MPDRATILTELEYDPPELDIEPILWLHRGHDGYVGLVRKPAEPLVDANGDAVPFENLCSLKVSELREMFPSMVNHLYVNGMFTINSMARAARYKNKITGLPDVLRKEPKVNKYGKFLLDDKGKIVERGHLRYMNACYVDLDVGREYDPDPAKMITWRDAMAAAGNLMDAGLLPQASIFARSGRGVYLFWILRDDNNPNLPPRFWPEKLQLYKMVNRAINARTKHLAADSNAIDASRVLRISGTQHSKTHRHAAYMLQTDRQGKGFTYTLSELAAFFGVPETKAALPEATRQTALIISAPEVYGRQVKLPGSQPNRIKGKLALNALRAQDFIVLEQAKGGWPKGCRRKRLTMYAEFLRLAGNSSQAALPALVAMASNCKPPYPSEDDTTTTAMIVAQVYAKQNVHRYSNPMLCKMLKVTPEVARRLDLKTILPAEVAAERKAARVTHRESNRTALVDFLRDYLKTHPKATKRGATAAAIAAGIQTNPTTVNQRLNELGHVVRGRGRPTKVRG